ncbi:MAG: glycosyl hydrolase 53 family protein [Oscillospiraceae bacterium]|nr:glycosyl hydrolase 53 family protein [Oscillospiraceae bacterium]
MRKHLSLFLAAILLLSLLSGCAGKPGAPGSETAAGTAAPATDSAAPATDSAAPETLSPIDPPEPGVIERQDVAPTGKLEGCSLYVKPVEKLPVDFIFGMDASQVPALEASGVKYYDLDGTEKDVFQILAENGVNMIRVRVWNDPFDAEGRGYGGGNCDINTALEIGKRATKYGMKLLVDFHYSDFWADPGKQMVPKAWAGMSLEDKEAALFRYTWESLAALYTAGVDVGMVQVGNETNGAMCGEKDWPSVVKLMAAGARAVRAVYPEAKVAVHFANPESGAYPGYARALADNGLDYDVFGSSYYPYWHGSLENLTNVLKNVRETYGKDVMVLETSYAWTTEDSDFSGNTISADSAVDKPYPYSLQGQVNNLRDVTQAVVDAGGIGVCYWEGTWIGVGTDSKPENQKLWEQFGSGWASSFAAEYDPEDAGKWYGGCAVDNQAFFDPQGRAMESLLAFNLIRYGNETELVAQAVEDIETVVTAGESFSLPETVEAIMSDNSRQSIPVTWSVDSGVLSEWLKSSGSHEINGEASGLPARLKLVVQGVNLLKNPSFEDGKDAPWTAENLGGCKELRMEQKAGDSKTGDWHYHFWSPDADKAEFTLEQSPEGLGSGSYDFSIWIMGGDCGDDCRVYAYAKLDGEIVATADMEITVWNEWHKGEITGIPYQEGQTLTLGIYVKAPAAGAWGKIDDASLSIR